MKLKTLSLLAGVAALSMSAIPFTANAQSDFNSPIQIAQAENDGTPRKFRKKFRKFEALGLSDAQKDQIKAIMQQARTEMKNVLTPEQVQQLEAAKKNGGRKKQGWRNLNLSESQRNQMRQIRESKKDQIKAVLTPEQLEKWEEMKQSRRERRQSRNR